MFDKPAHRHALKLLAIGFGLGAAFQLGVGLASQINPQVRVIEIRQVHTKPDAEHQDTAQRLNF